MTYTVANHNNSTLDREQVRWKTPVGDVVKIAAWAVPQGVHAKLGVPGHIDLYLHPTGWSVELDDAGYTDAGEDDLSDRIEAETLTQMGSGVTALDPDGADDSFAIIDGGLQIAVVRMGNGFRIPGFSRSVFATPESAAMCYLSQRYPSEMELAKSVATEIVFNNQALDYM